MMFGMLKGVGVGAGLMYLFDPDQGESRREWVGDQIKGAGRETVAWFDEALSDPVGHAPALLAAATGGLIGIRILSRVPLATIALGAMGMAFAAQSVGCLRAGGRPARLYPESDPGREGTDLGHRYEPEELAHYGAAGAGHSGGRRQPEQHHLPSQP